MTTVYHTTDDVCVWSIGFDQQVGGYVGRSEWGITPAFISIDAVVRYVDGGGDVRIERGSAHGGAERSGAEQGLVPSQQSSQYLAPMSAAEALARDIARRSHVKEVFDAHIREAVCSWNITLVDPEGKRLTLNSNKMRLSRCQKRVRAWADTIGLAEPRRNRRAMERKEQKDCKRKMRSGQVEISNLRNRLVMVTLTYADADGWRPNHIRDFMKLSKRSLGVNLFGAAFVHEMQERGVSHYHVLLYVKRGTNIPKPDDAGWWLHGSTRIETAKSPYYIVKYTGKEYQKVGLPKGARMFSVWIRQDAVPADVLFRFRLSSVPGWAHGMLEDTAECAGYDIRWKRAKGGGWLVVDTGEVLKSGWSLVSIFPDGGGLDEFW